MLLCVSSRSVTIPYIFQKKKKHLKHEFLYLDQYNGCMSLFDQCMVYYAQSFFLLSLFFLEALATCRHF